MKKILTGLVLFFIPNLSLFSQSIDSTFYSLEEAKKMPLKVKVLKIRDNHYRKIPQEIFFFSNLKELDISNNDISKIPDDIQLLTQLETLFASLNNIKDVSLNITKLKHLKCLHLEGNNLKQLPKAVLALRHLEILNISDNKIKVLKLPHSLNLRELSADFNFIDTLREDLFGFYDKIEFLSLKSNLIRYIPEDINQAEKLQYINLNNNKLRNLPEELIYMNSLDEVRLGKNFITELPELNKKSKIKIMDLSENPILKKDLMLFQDKSSIPTIFFFKRLNAFEYKKE